MVSCHSRPLPSRTPAQSKRPEDTRQLCSSFLLVPLLLETGTGHKAASTSTSVQYQEVAPQRPRPHSHGDSDLTETRPGWGCSAHAGTRRVTIRVRQEGTLVQHDSVFGVVFRRPESDTRRAIYLGLLKHITIHPSWEKASWR